MRSVDKVRQLLDVSPVTYPAYAAATVQARDQQLETTRPTQLVADTDTTVTNSNTTTMNLNEMKASVQARGRFEELVNSRKLKTAIGPTTNKKKPTFASARLSASTARLSVARHTKT